MQRCKFHVSGKTNFDQNCTAERKQPHCIQMKWQKNASNGIGFLGGGDFNNLDLEYTKTAKKVEKWWQTWGSHFLLTNGDRRLAQECTYKQS